MSQTQEEVTQNSTPASDDTLPAASAEVAPDLSPEKGDEFIASGQNKVELDLEDAPFLNEEPEAQEERKTEAAQGDSENKETTEEGEKPNKKKKLIIIGAIVAVLLLIIGGGLIFIFSSDDEILPNIIVVTKPEDNAPPKALELKLDPFVIQCIDGNGKIHFVKGSFILSTIHDDVYFEITNNQKVLRDAIYYYLEIQDPEVLLDPANHQLIKNGLFEIVNKYVMSGSIDHLYIDSLLIY